MWRSPDVLIAATKDKLVNEFISNAKFTTDQSESVALNMDKFGSITFAIAEKQNIECDIDTEHENRVNKSKMFATDLQVNYAF